ncbi:MAG: hypothetical protein KF819_11095 [Labilithrix sp.]|nr:hypothetical protein [Labilithrix sp.]
MRNRNGLSRKPAMAAASGLAKKPRPSTSAPIKTVSTRPTNPLFEVEECAVRQATVPYPPWPMPSACLTFSASASLSTSIKSGWSRLACESVKRTPRAVRAVVAPVMLRASIRWLRAPAFLTSTYPGPQVSSASRLRPCRIGINPMRCAKVIASTATSTAVPPVHQGAAHASTNSASGAA